jgi:hypothetical protein
MGIAAFFSWTLTPTRPAVRLFAKKDEKKILKTLLLRLNMRRNMWNGSKKYSQALQ